MDPSTSEPRSDNPVDDFTDCHQGIISRLNGLDELPALAEAATRGRRLAGELLAYFDEVVEQHHAEEEQVLIPALRGAAEPGDEATQVHALAKRIIGEHRALELLWGRIRADVKRIANGREAGLAAADVTRLVADYKAHAAFEEAEFLPLAQHVLGRKSNELAALGMSLHIRRMHEPVAPYV